MHSGVSKSLTNSGGGKRDAAVTADFRDFVSEKLCAASKSLNTPPLQGPTNAAISSATCARPNASVEQVVHACLLSATGLSIDTSADSLNLPREVVRVAHARAMNLVHGGLSAPDGKDFSAALSNHLDSRSDELPLGASIKSLSHWLSFSTSSFARCGLSLRLSLGRSASSLGVADHSHLADLLPILKGISSHGFRVFLRPSDGVVVASVPGLSKKLEMAGIEVHPLHRKFGGFGSIQFSVRPQIRKGASEREVDLRPDEISPRSLGMAGRVVVLGLVLALFVDF